MSQPDATHILKITCPDQPGIIARLSGYLSDQRCNIVDSKQYSDPESGLFFLRLSFVSVIEEEALQEAIGQIGSEFDMKWELHRTDKPMRVLVMVSRFGHCLNDLLYRYQQGQLKMDLRAVTSNHRDFYRTVAHNDIPFHHIPITKDTKAKAEARLMEIVEEEEIDLVVLARYMQILSPELCQKLSGKAINIHHSFLPSFKGATPYKQAHARGVKLIGATAHYVTSDLDEGPIIEQSVERVNHAMTSDELVKVGQDVENVVLARAVRDHLEHRVFLNGSKTVVFR